MLNSRINADASSVHNNADNTAYGLYSYSVHVSTYVHALFLSLQIKYKCTRMKCFFQIYKRFSLFWLKQNITQDRWNSSKHVWETNTFDDLISQRLKKTGSCIYSALWGSYVERKLLSVHFIAGVKSIWVSVGS